MRIQTKRFDELTDTDKVCLIGTVVTTAIYDLPETPDTEPEIRLTGTPANILEQDGTVLIQTEHEGSITWDTERFYATVTWIDYWGKI